MNSSKNISKQILLIYALHAYICLYIYNFRIEIKHEILKENNFTRIIIIWIVAKFHLRVL